MTRHYKPFDIATPPERQDVLEQMKRAPRRHGPRQKESNLVKCQEENKKDFLEEG